MVYLNVEQRIIPFAILISVYVIIILFKLFTDNPLLKKKGVPECILFVTTRITKYPLLIESLIKAAQKDRPSELEVLKQANNFVKVN